MKLPGYICLISFMLLAGCKPGINSADTLGLAANLDAPFDYYINNMHTQRFGIDGKPSYQLSASRVTHFPADDHTELANPVIVWLSNNSKPWIVTADEGNLHHKGDIEEFTLTGSVKANTSTAQTGTMLLETSRLNLLPKSKMGTTDADVKLSAAGTVLQGKGMQLNLARNTISLLNDVRGTHAP